MSIQRMIIVVLVVLLYVGGYWQKYSAFTPKENKQEQQINFISPPFPSPPNQRVEVAQQVKEQDQEKSFDTPATPGDSSQQQGSPPEPKTSNTLARDVNLLNSTLPGATGLSDSEYTIYIVQANDTLWGVVRKFYDCQEDAEIKQKIAEITKKNPGLNPDKLQIGQKLRLPGVPNPRHQFEEKRKQVLQQPKKKLPAIHRIRTGDTLYSLALTYYHDERKWLQILQANKGLDPRKMPLGKRLRIPACKPNH